MGWQVVLVVTGWAETDTAAAAAADYIPDQSFVSHKHGGRNSQQIYPPQVKLSEIRSQSCLKTLLLMGGCREGMSIWHG